MQCVQLDGSQTQLTLLSWKGLRIPTTDAGGRWALRILYNTSDRMLSSIPTISSYPFFFFFILSPVLPQNVTTKKMAPQAFTLTIQVKIHTQTGVGAHELETHFKNIDYAKKGDGGSVLKLSTSG